jgi:hypothetical protein
MRDAKYKDGKGQNMRVGSALHPRNVLRIRLFVLAIERTCMATLLTAADYMSMGDAQEIGSRHDGVNGSRGAVRTYLDC